MHWRFTLGSLLSVVTVLSMVGGLISLFSPPNAMVLLELILAPIVTIGIGLLVTFPIWPLLLATLAWDLWMARRKRRGSDRRVLGIDCEHEDVFGA